MKRHTVSISWLRTVCVLLFAGSLAFPAGPATAEGKKLTLSELRKQRRELAHRKRRIIYNNDGDNIAGWRGLDPAESRDVNTPEELRCTAGSHGESIKVP